MRDPGTDCPFCLRIQNGEYRETPGYHSAVVFEPLNPVTPGHLLVVPKMHVKDAAENAVVSGLTMEVAAVEARKIGDCNIITNIGPAATQTVFHLHIHVVPRTRLDGLKLPWTP